MIDTDVAWAAGLFDGEGCISARPRPRMQIIVEIKMVHFPTLLKFAEIVGGRAMPAYEHRRGNRTQWRVYLVDNAAEKALLLMLPYLRTKKEEAMLALEMRQTATSGHDVVPERIWRRRAHIVNALKLVKKREWKTV